MKKNVFSLKAWHFGVLCLCLTALIWTIDMAGLKKSPESFDSCFVEVNDVGFAEATDANVYCILFHDGESSINRKMEYNFSEFATAHLSDVHFYKVDVTNNAQACVDYRIVGVPSLLVFKEGQETDRFIGVVSASNFRKVFNKINP